MSPSEPQQLFVDLLHALGCPAPWRVVECSGRMIVDAEGKPCASAMPVASVAIVHERAELICSAVNAMAGVLPAGAMAPLDPAHLDALSAETAHFLRRVGAAVGE
ncbi:hypothetical protein [Methylobacterium nodulans]|uniref:Uncharacterized protein n=1 Tax=Methylobacterium nodulans (strain LMG 21967 / CNCM I-2342 / ORS 2060) TaxID=460265 RepID=B8ITR7_METNO|nr:hypothetical protein [Methylobacterium nodulans]ACL58983.1 conserved hypothetical protein [Methylobacterium nodulans ORS 2060]